MAEWGAIGDLRSSRYDTLALKLSQAGVGDYWDDADHWIRNQFAEAQLLNSDWMDDAVKELAVTPVGPYETGERVPERSEQDYTLIRKGNDVVNIDPSGKYCPLYQRSHYRENQVQWRKMTRFVSQQLIDW